MIRKIFYIFVVLMFLTNNTFSEIVKSFKVEGNERVSKKTIINFADVEINTDLNTSDFNRIIKNLYSTNFFENISLNISNGILIIKVKEFPIVQSIIFNGIKAKKFKDQLYEQISLKEKNPYNKLFLESDLIKIKNIFKRSGYYFVEIKLDEKLNENNTVDLIYNINMGEKALIGKINFIGDKKYKDRKLHSIITSEEAKFWKFISKGKFLDKERIDLDKRLLKNFFLNKGFYQVEIQDAFSQLIDNEYFALTFNINAGKRFFFNDLNLEVSGDFEKKKFSKITKIFKKLKNETYSLYKIEKLLDTIDEIALLENYDFIDSVVSEEIVNENKLNLTFKIKESEKFYVERINIIGNHITYEEFIRNQLVVDEGDPFNKILHNKSINALKSKGIFGDVTYKMRDGTNLNQKIIDIEVEERPTGEISAGAGYGTDGSTFSFAVSENNFRGKGINLDASLSVSEDKLKGLFAYTHPNFNYSERALTTSIQSTTTDKLTEFGYKSSINALSLGTSYEQFDNIFFSPTFFVGSEKLETEDSASATLKKQEGSYFDSSVQYSFLYDKRNQPFRPTSGYYSKFTQSLPIASDGLPILNGYEVSSYKEIVDEMVVSLSFYGRAINSLSDDDVRVSKRLTVPSSRIRGFESGKIGPKDSGDYVGGNYAAAVNASTTVPYLFQTLETIDMKMFLDTANVWGVDYSDTVDDSNKIRSSFGIAVDWYTVIGPLSFSLSQPITKANTDKTEKFRFQLGTTF
tara:strand:+ start:4382 stop:6622 length:2241 start_codon:yes stop_codon:yes gene_type:complete